MNNKLYPFVLALFIPLLAQGELHPREMDGNPANGYEMVYDDVLDITWVADASLAGKESFGVPGIKPGGDMDFDTAKQWASAMNASDGGKGYLGVTGWRLPSVQPVNGYAFDTVPWYDGRSDRGYWISGPYHEYNPNPGSPGFTGSELAYHFYNNFGFLGYCSIIDGLIVCDRGRLGQYSNEFAHSLFRGYSNLMWMDRGNDFNAWYFDFYSGYQAITQPSANGRVWAVRDGDVTHINTDFDSKPNYLDNCPFKFNWSQEDTDGDGIGNACDPYPDETDHRFAQCNEEREQAISEIVLLEDQVAGLSRSLSSCSSRLSRAKSDIREKDAVIANQNEKINELEKEVEKLEAQLDSDADGVPDQQDNCPGTMAWAWRVDSNGCHPSQLR